VRSGNDQHHDARRARPAVGILVDDATVEVENINEIESWNQRRTWTKLSSTGGANRDTCLRVHASICIVFAPMFLLSGVARYLFVPLAEAVVFAMLLPISYRGPSFRPWPVLLRGDKHAVVPKPQSARSTSEAF